MEELREITQKEYDSIIEEMEETAKLLVGKAEEEGWDFRGPWPEDYFYSNMSSIPCLYRKRDSVPFYGSEAYNPVSGMFQQMEEVPENYKTDRRFNVPVIHHLTLDGCPLIIPFKTVVKCTFYDDTKDKYFTCEHLVGDCPAKE